MTTGIIGLVVLAGLCIMAWRGAHKERTKFQAQRDALLALLDKEGRGQEALEVIIKCWR